MGMIQTFKKGDVIRDFAVENNKIRGTIEMGDAMVSNPTLEMMYADGWEDWMRPVPKPYVPTREDKINEEIRARYSADDEAQIVREKIAGKEGADERFAEYNVFVEQILAKYPGNFNDDFNNQ